MKASLGELNVLTDKIIGAAIEVHRQLGPGLLESTYEKCLIFELQHLGLVVESQVSLPVIYKGMNVEAGYKIDLLVEKSVIIELKAVESILPVHEAQILTYLKFSGTKLGLLLNFHVKLMKDGIRRFVN